MSRSSRNPSRHRLAPIVVLFVMIVVASTALFPSCDKKPTKTDKSQSEPTTPAVVDPLVRQKQRLAELGELREDVASANQLPWVAGTEIGKAIGTYLEHLRGIENQVLMTGQDPEYVAIRLENLDPRADDLVSRGTAFLEAQREDAGPLRHAFTTVSVATTAVATLRAGEIDVREEEIRSREISREYENGLRFWATELAKPLRGDQPDEGLRNIGLKTLARAATDAAPLNRRLQPSKIELNALTNHINGIDRRMDWVRRMLGELPESEPLRKSEKGRVDYWTKQWQPLREQAQTLKASVLDRDAARLRRVAEVEKKMAALLKDINDTLIPVARKHGLKLG